MRANRFLLVLSAFLFPLIIAAQEPQPEDRPLLDSIKALFLAPKENHAQMDQLTLYPERDALPGIGGRNRLTFTYSLQSDPTAPLVVVIPGLGGFAIANSTLFLSELAYSLGYSVITLPSTTHWSFALAASSDGRTGYLPKDGVDQYRLLLTLKYRLERETGIRPRQFGIVGFSYGGLDGAQLARQDLRQNAFGFDFLIMINSPLKLSTALRKVDQFYELGDSWTEKKKKGLSSLFLGRAGDLTKGRFSLGSPEEARKAFPMGENDLAWLLAYSFRDALMDSAYVAEKISGRDLPRAETVPGSIEDYLSEKVLEPIATRKNKTIEALLGDSDLLSPLLENNQQLLKKTKVILFHARNDFLSFPEDENLLKNLPFEVRLSESGGHMGNLASPRVIDELTSVLRSLQAIDE